MGGASAHPVPRLYSGLIHLHRLRQTSYKQYCWHRSGLTLAATEAYHGLRGQISPFPKETSISPKSSIGCSVPHAGAMNHHAGI